MSTNLGFWVKADTGTSTTTDGVAIDLWTDQSAAGNNLGTVGAGFDPFYITNSGNFNFNPSVNFPNSKVLFGTQAFGTGTGATFDFIAVTNDYGGAGFDGIGLIGNRGGGSGVSFNINNPTDQFQLAANTGSGDLVASGTNSGLTPVLLNGGYTGPGYRAAINGAAFTTNATSINITNQTFRVGEGGFDGEFYNGQIAELVVYNTNNGPATRNRIESYLGLKYGITLDQTVATNYVSSTGGVIWDATTNAGYDGDIFGIGRDDTSGLNQKVSKSVNADAVITVALDNNFVASNLDASRTTPHTNDSSVSCFRK